MTAKTNYLQLISSLLFSIKPTYDFQYFGDFKARFSDRGTISFNAQRPLKIFSRPTKFFRDQNKLHGSYLKHHWLQRSYYENKKINKKLKRKRKKWGPTLTKKVTLHGYWWLSQRKLESICLQYSMSAKFCIQYLAKAA